MIWLLFYVDPDLGSRIFLIRDPGWKNSDPGWKNSNPGSGINIPEPPHWNKVLKKIKNYGIL
jgi:hypothetical protein